MKYCVYNIHITYNISKIDPLYKCKWPMKHRCSNFQKDDNHILMMQGKISVICVRFTSFIIPYRGGRGHALIC